MTGVAQGPVTVIGDGVVGLAVALALARRGRSVRVLGEGAPSASAAAAGMIAPASEALLDGLGPAAAAAMRQARERWSTWAGRLGLDLHAGGALHQGDRDELFRRAAAARALSFRTTWPAPSDHGGEALLLPEDALLDPAPALAALARAVEAHGGTLERGRVEVERGRLSLARRPLQGEVVVAAGWGSASLSEVAPELGRLLPIKGQLLRFVAPSAPGPVIRAPDVYLAPQPGGWLAGATMEVGRSDLEPDPDAATRLRAAAARLRPDLGSAPAVTVVGVRAAVADALPLVGRSSSGVWLATGLRRNGWLLAPLVAEGMAAYLGGTDPDTALAGQARAWNPARVLTPDQGVS